MKKIILFLALLISISSFSQRRLIGGITELPRNISGQDSLLVEKSGDSGYLYRLSLGELKQLSGINRIYNVINIQALNYSPVDAQTVHFGMLPKAPVTAANTSKIYFRQSGTIQSAEIYSFATTAGTGEAWSLYIRKNNTTDFLIATVNSATGERVFSNLNINIPINAGDYIEIKSTNPTWATNPNNITFGGYITIN